jgi:uncharacterized cupredoxin-like copper-binding protein
MMTGTGPFGAVGMGGMFSVLKVRRDQKRGDYKDPGWYRTRPAPWHARSVKRTIPVGMSDAMRFTPDTLTVRKGETVRFVFRNDGRQLHEFVLGTRKELDAHAALMMKFPGMEHDEPFMAHVPPGQTAEIIWTFNRAGEFDFACLIAGHYQAGMVGKITVAAR